MPWYDLPEDQLKDYRRGTREPADLDRWWRERLDEARAAAHVERQLRHLREFLR
jgi:cephalosporin-C deacetylase